MSDPVKFDTLESAAEYARHFAQGEKEASTLVGRRFGRWTVLSFAHTVKHLNWQRYYVCRCDCGTQKLVNGPSLLAGRSHSCGCLSRELDRRLPPREGAIHDHKVGCCLIPLLHGYTKVSPEDCEWVSKSRWHVDASGYAARGGSGTRRARLHVLIAKPSHGLETDHINRDKLDNRRENLRVVSHRENSLNKGLNKNNWSGHPGVYWSRGNQKWVAQVTSNYKTRSLGLFQTIEGAIAARTAAMGDEAMIPEVLFKCSGCDADFYGPPLMFDEEFWMKVELASKYCGSECAIRDIEQSGLAKEAAALR